MTKCDMETRDAGIEWVKRRPACDPLFQTFTDCRLNDAKAPSRSTTLLRARMHYLELLLGFSDIKQHLGAQLELFTVGAAD
jgi:hypothetical protein